MPCPPYPLAGKYAIFLAHKSANRCGGQVLSAIGVCFQIRGRFQQGSGKNDWARRPGCARVIPNGITKAFSHVLNDYRGIGACGGLLSEAATEIPPSFFHAPKIRSLSTRQARHTSGGQAATIPFARTVPSGAARC
jgi:hypothetical protein